MTIVTPTDRPKSVRNRYVIEVFGGVFAFGFLCRCKGFCHRTESDLFLFLVLLFKYGLSFPFVTPIDFNINIRRIRGLFAKKYITMCADMNI